MKTLRLALLAAAAVALASCAVPQVTARAGDGYGNGSAKVADGNGGTQAAKPYTLRGQPWVQDEDHEY